MGNVTNPTDTPTPPKKDQITGIKGGVSGRVSGWMTKPAEAEKATPAPQPEPEPAPAPAKTPDAKPGDIGNKRGLWEAKKSTPPAKVTFGGKGKFVNGGTRP